MDVFTQCTAYIPVIFICPFQKHPPNMNPTSSAWSAFTKLGLVRLCTSGRCINSYKYTGTPASEDHKAREQLNTMALLFFLVLSVCVSGQSGLVRLTSVVASNPEDRDCHQQVPKDLGEAVSDVLRSLGTFQIFICDQGIGKCCLEGKGIKEACLVNGSPEM